MLHPRLDAAVKVRNYNFRFLFVRIVGNEIPLRDRPGGRLRAYEFILNNEPRHTDSHRVWLVNRMYSQARLTEVVELLSDHKEHFKIIPFSPTAYRACRNKRERILYAVNPNVGRNVAVGIGQPLAQITLPLDGECFFTNHSWYAFKQAMSEHDRPYYSVPMRRVDVDDFYTVDHSLIPFEEAQLAFRYDADLRFDESIPYPCAEKCELLWRLGHSRDHAKQYVLDDTTRCQSAGYVLHVNSGPTAIEQSLEKRVDARERGLDALIDSVNREYNIV